MEEGMKEQTKELTFEICFEQLRNERTDDGKKTDRNERSNKALINIQTKERTNE